MLCYYWYDTTTTAETTVQLLQYCKLQYDHTTADGGLARSRRPSSPSYTEYTARWVYGRRVVTEIPGRWRHPPAHSWFRSGDRRVRHAARPPPTLPPSAYCLPLVRPTFVEGLPPDVSEYAHTSSRCRSVFDLNTMATRVYVIIIIIIDIYYSVHITLILHIFMYIYVYYIDKHCSGVSESRPMG